MLFTDSGLPLSSFDRCTGRPLARVPRLVPNTAPAYSKTAWTPGAAPVPMSRLAPNSVGHFPCRICTESIIRLAMPRRVRFPCSVCERTTDTRSKESIECVACGLWVHAECVPLTTEQVASYGDSEEVFICPRCVLDDGEVNYMQLLHK